MTADKYTRPGIARGGCFVPGIDGSEMLLACLRQVKTAKT